MTLELQSAKRATLSLLREYRELSEQLVTSLRSDEKDVPGIVKQIVDTDQRLYRSARVLLQQLARCERIASTTAQARMQHATLLRIASRMQRAESLLDERLQRAKDVLSASDSNRKLQRTTTVAEVLRVAEQVSYSNAAPVGEHALNAAARDGFRRGWGTPAPQQHMLAASRFAQLTRDGLGSAEQGGDGEEGPLASSEGWRPGDPILPPSHEPTMHDPISQPAAVGGKLREVPPPPSNWKPGDPLPSATAAGVPVDTSSAPQQAARVSLGFVDDDDDDDFG